MNHPPGRNQEGNNLNSEQRRGLKKLQKRIKKGETNASPNAFRVNFLSYSQSDLNLPRIALN